MTVVVAEKSLDAVSDLGPGTVIDAKQAVVWGMQVTATGQFDNVQASLETSMDGVSFVPNSPISISPGQTALSTSYNSIACQFARATLTKLDNGSNNPTVTALLCAAKP